MSDTRPGGHEGRKENRMNKETKKWMVEYSHDDGRSGSV